MEEPVNLLTSLHLQGSSAESTTQVTAVTEEPVNIHTNLNLQGSSAESATQATAVTGEPVNLHTNFHLQGSSAESTTLATSVTEEPKTDNHHSHGDGGSVVAETMNSEISDGGLEYGCSHYRRRCKIRAPCCNEIFDCRHCHNEAKNDFNVNQKERHMIPRHQVQQVICTLCGTEQEVRQMCINCGVCMGKYFCGVCKLFDDDISKRQYHCDGCGICRIGGQENFFHCDKCRCCYSNLLRNSHPCIEGAMHHDCPVCFEYLFDSIDDVTVMPCGHTIHNKCFKEMRQHMKYACPLCFKSVCDMSKAWEKLDMEIAATPMPECYQNKSIWILCNDCGANSEVPFHIVAHKCPNCKSYNTRQTRG